MSRPPTKRRGIVAAMDDRPRDQSNLSTDRVLTPEEDAIGVPDDEDDDVDDLLPADLWF